LAYNSGVRTVKRAQAYDGQALKASTPEKAAKSHERAQEAYRESISAFVDAVTAQPTMYKSWYYIGLADRHLGNYDEALSAYAKVLELSPHHPDAIENRGEVFLALNQIEEAQSAYIDLFRESRPLANELMSAMRRWIESRRQDAQGIAAFVPLECLQQYFVDASTKSRFLSYLLEWSNNIALIRMVRCDNNAMRTERLSMREVEHR
jgi:tetratricopeptide (TPR) repeat protein